MRRSLLYVCLVSLALSVPLIAQSHFSEITGRVRDSSGAALPSATVTVTSSALSEGARSTLTDGNGVYRFANLPGGMYSVSAELKGFTTIKREAFHLVTDFTARIDFELKIGSLANTITVSTGEPFVDVSASAIVRTIDAAQTIDVGPTHPITPLTMQPKMTALVAPGRQLSQIYGTVLDTSGAALPGVTVEVGSPSLTDHFRRTLTDSAGHYRFADLPPGTYTVTFTLTGFTTVKREGLQLVAGGTERVDAQLKVGALTETITVTGAAPKGWRAPKERAPQSRLRQTGERRKLPRGFNTETYDSIVENPWTQVSRESLSTFSIDVDTASYSNVRRFLNGGQRPPRDAARIEELINYFPVNYPEPSGSDPVSITTALGECPWNPQHRLALIGLQAKHMDASQMPPRNLVFLIDVSGSMNEPEKLPLVKNSLAMLARNLTEQDRIAIVVYAGAAGLVLPSTGGNDHERVLAAIERLQAGGSTNGAQGIQLAYAVARDNFIENGVNRVILATDGDFNVGVTNQGDLVRLIEENRKSGVNLSVLGFGMGNFKDSTLEKLADKGDGNYAYIDSPMEAVKVLVQGAAGTLVTVAKDVKLQIEFNPRTVTAFRLLGYENRILEHQDFNDDTKDAGDMGAGHSVTAIYEIVPTGQKADVSPIDPLKYQRTAAPSAKARLNELMTIKLRYKKPEDKKSALISTTFPTAMRMSDQLGFASAVAEFGLLLRDSEFKGSASFGQARELAERYRGEDPFGYRTELIDLMKRAQQLPERQLLEKQLSGK